MAKILREGKGVKNCGSHNEKAIIKILHPVEYPGKKQHKYWSRLRTVRKVVQVLFLFGGVTTILLGILLTKSTSDFWNSVTSKFRIEVFCAILMQQSFPGTRYKSYLIKFNKSNIKLVFKFICNSCV